MQIAPTQLPGIVPDGDPSHLSRNALRPLLARIRQDDAGAKLQPLCFALFRAGTALGLRGLEV